MIQGDPTLHVRGKTTADIVQCHGEAEDSTSHRLSRGLNNESHPLSDDFAALVLLGPRALHGGVDSTHFVRLDHQILQ